MQIKEEEISHLKSEISYTSKSHLFRVKGKLAPRYVRPFKIINRKEEVAYQLELPPQLSDIHDVFHVSYLELGGDLIYSERPIKILDSTERVTCSKVIKM
jgi:hypothetical protein